MRATVMCAVISGDPPLNFAWYKDGIHIKDHNSISIKTVDEFTSTLLITKLGPESNGNYTCKVSNVDGSDENFDVLSMKGKNIACDTPFFSIFLI